MVTVTHDPVFYDSLCYCVQTVLQRAQRKIVHQEYAAVVPCLKIIRHIDKLLPEFQRVMAVSASHSLTHSLTYSPTHSHTHSFAHSHTHTLIRSLTHSLTHTLIRSLTHTHTLIHSLTHTLTHSLTHTLTHSHTHSLTHSHTHSHTHTHTLTHSLTHSPSIIYTHTCSLPLPLSLRILKERVSRNSLTYSKLQKNWFVF